MGNGLDYKECGKEIPAIISVWVLVSTIYTVGYFVPVDVRWMEMLTLYDIFSRSWTSLPLGVAIISISMSMSFLLQYVEYAVSKRSRIVSILISSGLIAGAIGAAGYLLNYKFNLFPDFDVTFILVIILLSIILLEVYKSSNVSNIPIYIFGSAMIISVVFAYGLYQGHKAIHKGNSDIIYFTNGRYSCVNIYSALEKGVIISHAPSGSSFIKTDRIVSMARRVGCRSGTTFPRAQRTQS